MVPSEISGPGTPPNEAARAEQSLSADPTSLPPVPEGINCPDCGYDLRGLGGGRCPECGFDLEIVRTQTPQIPWARRSELGRFRAYWLTVWLVCRHPGRLYAEMVRPVSFRDCQRFRWATFRHAFLPLLICLCIGTITAQELQQPMFLPIAAGVVAYLGLTLIVLPGAGSYLFESRRLTVEQRNRGIALSYYTWAPLGGFVFAGLSIVVGCVTALIWDAGGNRLALAVAAIWWLAGVLLIVAAILLAGARLTVLGMRVLREHGRAWLRVNCIIVLATLSVLALMALVPLSVFCLMVVWQSLH